MSASGPRQIGVRVGSIGPKRSEVGCEIFKRACLQFPYVHQIGRRARVFAAFSREPEACLGVLWLNKKSERERERIEKRGIYYFEGVLVFLVCGSEIRETKKHGRRVNFEATLISGKGH